MIIGKPKTTSVLTADQLRELRRVLQAADPALTLGDLALDWGLADESELFQSLAATLDLPFIPPGKVAADGDALDLVPAKLVHRYGVFPLSVEENVLRLAVSDPFNMAALDAVAAATGLGVSTVICVPVDLNRLIKSQLGVGAETIDGLIAAQGSEDGVELADELAFDGSEDAEAAQQASVVRLVNEILSEAIEARASDIHIEAQERGLKIRYRIDGVLQKQPAPSEMNRFRNAIVSRLKIMARLNIAEKRVPQDGRIKLRVVGREVDIRLSIIPMLHGESIVMRILDKSNLSFSLRDIGMPEHIYDTFSRLIRLPHGIVLVTGPTGSGKTTTLYSALNEIKSEDTKIITTEDPIEYQLEGINQIQVHAKVGLTFAASLRSILRHDPDVCLVGEIRDLETAINATQASLTGHLVFSTLHTNDSAGAFMRLCDMGVEPFLVSSTLEGVMAQRLVRRLCRECRESYEPDPEILPPDFPQRKFEMMGGRMWRPVGCPKCRGNGYAGRVGIYELLTANEDIRRLANERGSSNEIKKVARRCGMTTLRDDAWTKAFNGITSLDEVMRVTKED
jgi:general secretion pathway protein E/type IV pilus assembly protein PilB